ncbi:hypothetical protein GCM10010206_60560 [Streptomyces cinerochromogenes]|nr:hypothetical protein GCM10010206_60560 [Streptomyces cinerochromogenes]
MRIGAHFDLIAGQLGADPITEFTGRLAHHLRSAGAEHAREGIDQEELLLDTHSERGWSAA